jgi:gamma-glutamylcyclotransferase (GGCT)/AIG2-like uncharacterized protein YtfP
LKPTPYLFVYGTLKKGSRVPERQPLEDPGAVLSDNEADLVYGELYELKDVEATLRDLDAYEGGEFKRQLVDVSFPDFGFPLECWAYLYQGPLEGLTPVPGGRFLV